MDKIIFKKVGQRLKQARESRKITLEDAGKKVDVHKSTVLRWENGETEKIKLPILETLASFYGVNPVWLMGHDVSMTINSNESITSKDINPAVVFVYGTIPAGIPIECIEDIIDTEEISADMLKGGREYFALKIKGDSMEPDFLDGDTVIFRKQDDCENGDDCVVMVNGSDGTFKRVFKNENGIILQPLNNKYQPMPYSNEQIENLPVKILGVYEELRRRNKRKNK